MKTKNYALVITAALVCLLTVLEIRSTNELKMIKNSISGNYVQITNHVYGVASLRFKNKDLSILYEYNPEHGLRLNSIVRSFTKDEWEQRKRDGIYGPPIIIYYGNASGIVAEATNKWITDYDNAYVSKLSKSDKSKLLKDAYNKMYKDFVLKYIPNEHKRIERKHIKD